MHAPACEACNLSLFLCASFTAALVSAWVVHGKYLELASKMNQGFGRSLGIPPGIGAFGFGAALCIALVFAWLAVILMPYGWHTEDSLMYSFTVSLYSFGVERNEEGIKSQQHHPVTRLSQLFDTMEEQDNSIWLSVARYEFCQAHVSEAWCEYFQRLQLASWTLMGLVCFGLCCLLMGVMAGFCFHFIKPRADFCTWGIAYVLAAPVAIQSGILQYYQMTSGFGTLIDEAGSTFGWTFTVAAILSCLTWIPSWIMISFAFGLSTGEDSGDEEKMLGDSSESDYGAMIQTIRGSMAEVPVFGGTEYTESSAGGLNSPTPGSPGPAVTTPATEDARSEADSRDDRGATLSPGVPEKDLEAMETY